MPHSLDLYRPNVGIVLVRTDGRVWLGRRVGAIGPRRWQFPQGGVDRGEPLEAAALRELREETGVSSVTFLARTRDWICYDFPPGHGRRGLKRWVGQKQVWFLYRFEGAEHEIDIVSHSPPEFDAWRWATPDDALEVVVEFKLSAYRAMMAELKPYMPSLEGSSG